MRVDKRCLRAALHVCIMYWNIHSSPIILSAWPKMRQNARWKSVILRMQNFTSFCSLVHLFICCLTMRHYRSLLCSLMFGIVTYTLLHTWCVQHRNHPLCACLKFKMDGINFDGSECLFHNSSHHMDDGDEMKWGERWNWSNGENLPKIYERSFQLAYLCQVVETVFFWLPAIDLNPKVFLS